MPRASWRGFLRLSLVSCPIYLSPADRVRLQSIIRDRVSDPRRAGRSRLDRFCQHLRQLADTGRHAVRSCSF